MCCVKKFFFILMIGVSVFSVRGAALLEEEEVEPRTIVLSNESSQYNMHIRYSLAGNDDIYRRVVAPETTLMLRGAIDHLFWYSEGALLRGVMRRIQLPGHSCVKIIHTPRETVEVQGFDDVNRCLGTLRNRGVTNLRRVFPALWTRQKKTTAALGWAKWLVGKKGEAGFEDNREVNKVVSDQGLERIQAARYILGLTEFPSIGEIDQAYNQYDNSFDELSAALGVQVTPTVRYALNEAREALLARTKREPNYEQLVEKERDDRHLLFVNETNRPVYVAAYYVTEKQEAVQATEPIRIPAGGEQAVKVPGGPGRRLETGTRRRVLASFIEDELKPVLNPIAYRVITNADVGGSLWHSNYIYLVLDEETRNLKALTTFEYGDRELPLNIEQDAQTILAKNSEQGAVLGDASHFESAYLAERLRNVQRALQPVLGRLSEEQTPRVGIGFTGGGYRAMIKTLGFLVALEEAELLDWVLYMAGLSGSTWTLVSYLDAKIQNNNTYTFGQLAEKLRNRVAVEQKSLMPNRMDRQLWSHLNSLKARFSMPSVGYINTVYGYMLAKMLLSGDLVSKQKRHLSDLREALDGTVPLPILTAVSRYPDKTGREVATWFEFSPYLVGGRRNARWIDSKFFGRAFNRGLTGAPDKGMEEFLSYILAICGSAYAGSLEEVNFFTGTRLVPSMIKDWESLIRWKFPRPKEFNFTYGMPDAVGGDREVIHFIDGAHDLVVREQGDIPKLHNFASVPLLGRELDVIILCDSVRGPNIKHLLAAQTRARALGHPFPDFDPQEVQNNLLSNEPTLISDDDPYTPVIVYLGAFKDDTYEEFPRFDPSTADFAKTWNFTYTLEQFDKLVGLAKHSMRKALPVIQEALRQAHAKRQARLAEPLPEIIPDV